MSWIENTPVVVVVAHHFNPSILNPVWLAKHGILSDDGNYLPNSVFTGHLVQAVTEDYVLVMTTDQLQFILLAPNERRFELVREKVGKLIRVLPEVPYRAVGLNFNWHKVTESNRIAEETRQLFAGRDDGIFSRFKDSNARFGAYLSKDFGPFRMKLDMKPVILESGHAKSDRIQFEFNFHHDIPLGVDAPSAISKLFDEWNATRAEAIETIKTIGYREHP